MPNDIIEARLLQVPVDADADISIDDLDQDSNFPIYPLVGPLGLARAEDGRIHLTIFATNTKVVSLTIAPQTARALAQRLIQLMDHDATDAEHCEQEQAQQMLDAFKALHGRGPRSINDLAGFVFEQYATRTALNKPNRQ